MRGTHIARGRLRNGRIVIAAYFVLTYFLPMIGNQILRAEITSSYRLYPASALAVAEVFAVFGLWWALEQVRFGIPRLPATFAASWKRLGCEYRHYRPLIAVVALVASVLGIVGGLSGWRYAGAISSESSPLLIPFIVVNAIATLDVFHGMFVMTPVRRRSLLTRATDCFMAAAVLLAANGVLSAFLGLTAVLWALFPNGFRRLVFFPSGHYNVARIVKIGLAIVLLGVAFCVAWVVGNVIKSSSATDLRTLLENPRYLFENVLGRDSPLIGAAAYTVERQSVHYYSLLYTTAVPRSDLQPDGHSVVVYPLRTLLWRFDYLLFGGSQGEPRSPVGSLMQLNYRLLTEGPLNDRSGTSPGLIAAFNYVFPPLLAVFAGALYLRCLSPRLGMLFYQHDAACLSPIGALIAVQFVAVLFHSPIDMLILLDDGFIWVVVLFVLSSVKLRQMRRAAALTRASLAPSPASYAPTLGYPLV